MAGLILGCLVPPTLAAGSGLPAPTAEQTAVLEQHRASFAQGLSKGRAEACVAGFAEAVRLMPEYHGTIFGREGARQYYGALLERFTISRYERQSMATLNLGERLVEFGRFTQRMVRNDTSEARELEGKYVEVWTRANGGAWQVTTALWNYSKWPEFADELRFPHVPSVRIAMEAHVPVRDGLSFELAALNQLQERAIVEKDHAVWSMFYADDAVILANHGAACEGRSEIDGYLKDHTGGMPVFEKLDIRNDRIDDLGEWVIDYASHVANWRNGDASGVNTGKNLRVWRREPRGGLKMVCQAGTYD